MPLEHRPQLPSRTPSRATSRGPAPGGWRPRARRARATGRTSASKASHAQPGGLLWSQMKDNAEDISSTKESGVVKLFSAFKRRAVEACRSVRLHLIGHSAGAIVHTRLCAAGAEARLRRGVDQPARPGRARRRVQRRRSATRSPRTRSATLRGASDRRRGAPITPVSPTDVRCSISCRDRSKSTSRHAASGHGEAPRAGAREHPVGRALARLRSPGRRFGPAIG